MVVKAVKMIVDCKYIYRKFKYIRKKGISIDLCSSILCDILKLMIDDIIKHNTYVEIPKSWGSAMLYMKEISGDEFKDRYRNGEFQDVDYLSSGYTAYKISVKSNTFDEGFEINLNDKIEDVITKRTNKGYRY